MEAVAYSLAKEERGNNIHVNIVAPGLIETDMAEMMVKFQGRVKDSISELADDSPFGRLGYPEDIAGSVAFLCSERASYITNQRITVAGS
jgi:NAD(P)-dependent dehydrogenase (short-subunit alcohol dehydrogenase family)